MSDRILFSILSPETIKDLSKVTQTNFRAKERLEGTILFEGFNITKAGIDKKGKIGRDHYYFKEIVNGKKRVFHFCVDYDGYIKEINLQEEDV